MVCFPFTHSLISIYLISKSVFVPSDNHSNRWKSTAVAADRSESFVVNYDIDYRYKISISIRFVAAGRSLVRFFDSHQPPATFFSRSIGVTPDCSNFLLGMRDRWSSVPYTRDIMINLNSTENHLTRLHIVKIGDEASGIGIAETLK